MLRIAGCRRISKMRESRLNALKHVMGIYIDIFRMHNEKWNKVLVHGNIYFYSCIFVLVCLAGWMDGWLARPMMACVYLLWNCHSQKAFSFQTNLGNLYAHFTFMTIFCQPNHVGHIEVRVV